MTNGPICLVPRMVTQTVAAADVATALVDLVEAGPSGRAPDLAGPEQNQMVDLDPPRREGPAGSDAGSSPSRSPVPRAAP